jgi:hypothetical protein
MWADATRLQAQDQYCGLRCNQCAPEAPAGINDCGLLATFGEGCPKALIIQTVMQLSHFLAIAPITFFNSMR